MPKRTPTPIDALAESFLEAYAQLDPIEATMAGVSGHDDAMPDFSPAGRAELAALNTRTLATLATLTPVDATDRDTAAALRDRLGLEIELHEAGVDVGMLNVLSSPLQWQRDVFDLMPSTTLDDWATIATRLKALPDAMESYLMGLRASVKAGTVVPIRQVEQGIEQAAELAGPESFFPEFVAGAKDLPESLQRDLALAARNAVAAYGELERVLTDEVAPCAPDLDAVGRERYSLWSRYFVGAEVDLDETYEWGLEELARINAEMLAVAGQIAGPGAMLEEATAVLDADPARKLHGTEALQAWMQTTSDASIAALDGVHFDIPAEIRTLECLIAPTQNGGVYYTGPSDDLTRPGRMWWSVPKGETEFTTWAERTTVNHEGVPGHHLQIGSAVLARDTLNSWRRMFCWSSGYGEGWALYAERLMAEFGFMDDPGDRLGLLDGERLRATRVVFDIGVHLRKPVPRGYGEGHWDADSGWELLRANTRMPEPNLRFEWNRYLGWPGQAPSYKIGQRLWLQLRDEALARGENLRDFHRRALTTGSLPLSVLAESLRG
ncbi:MAG: DUF885 domain-containing protein [Propionibacteriaceae bacterium]|nr:DUF885 domain-containing protein [Micropruina sp.]